MKIKICTLAISLFLSGCQTVLYNDRGVALMRLPNDVDKVHYHKKGNEIELTMVNHRPSTTIRATGTAVGAVAGGVAGMITAAGLHP